jgi:MFS family permease
MRHRTHILDRDNPLSYTSDVGELLAAILGAIAELLLEAFLEIISAVVVDIVSTALLDLFTDLKEAIQGSRVLTGFMYGMFGVLTGALSLLVLPHRLVHRERPFGFHGISLLISPVIAGLVLSCVAVMRKWGKKVTPVETFGYGFAFALGMAVIRFLFAQ